MVNIDHAVNFYLTEKGEGAGMLIVVVGTDGKIKGKIRYGKARER